MSMEYDMTIEGRRRYGGGSLFPLHPSFFGFPMAGKPRPAALSRRAVPGVRGRATDTPFFAQRKKMSVLFFFYQLPLGWRGGVS